MEQVLSNQAVKLAIEGAQADLKANGAVFHPFRIRSTTNLREIWDWRFWWPQVLRIPLPNAITFYQVEGEGDFFPLGDTAILGAEPLPETSGSLLFAPVAGSNALAHPKDFKWVLDDHGSRNPRDIAYWKPIPPNGDYRAVGLCFGRGKPNPEKYWCVHRKHLRDVPHETHWSDKGSGWESHNGNLWSPSFGKKDPISASEGKMLFLPPTFSNPEARLTLSALEVEPAFLDVDPVQPGDYHAMSNEQGGRLTSFGLKKIAILPHTAVPDDMYKKAEESPFYFIADEPVWERLFSESTSAGGKYEVRHSIGISEEESKEFSERTSLTVSAETGVAFTGASAKISASYTREFGISTRRTDKKSTEVQDILALNLPEQPVTWFWQGRDDIVAYRFDAESFRRASYRTNSIRYSPD